ncbi:MAG: hypothetical protein E6J73_08605 [Deltaproteobacteria bacterium]|nr:MAG: hypothetical protein E6J73_08605 [Deltaproteobacteria bacterium]
MAGALDGIKILDITNYIAGPFATMLLADLGAEVYKIETPGAGDPFRTWDKEPKDYSPSFCGMNRNKKSVTLDIKQTEGKEIFLRLAQDADVIVENLRPGVVDRLGIGYEEIKKINPRIIYCSISAFGQNGPYRKKPGYNTLGQALSGLLSVLTDLDKPEGPRQRSEGRNLAARSDDQFYRLQHDPVSFQRRDSEEEQPVENSGCLRVGCRRWQAVCNPSFASAKILACRHRGYRTSRSTDRSAHQRPSRAPQELRHDKRNFVQCRAERAAATLARRAGGKRRAVRADQ